MELTPEILRALSIFSKVAVFGGAVAWLWARGTEDLVKTDREKVRWSIIGECCKAAIFAGLFLGMFVAVRYDEVTSAEQQRQLVAAEEADRQQRAEIRERLWREVYPHRSAPPNPLDAR
jgi:hypothetical protein